MVIKMAQGTPKPGEMYLHFKNRLYQIITVAKHSETGEILVVYQALYGTYDIYVRPLEMFVSEVDHEKYPEVTQKYRFMFVKKMKTENEEQEHVLDKPYPDRKVENKVENKIAREEKEYDEVPTLLMDFFDAKTYEEKYRILLEMRSIVTDAMINNMAVVLDLVISEGDLDVRYEELKRCLRTQQKYETSRLH